VRFDVRLSPALRREVAALPWVSASQAAADLPPARVASWASDRGDALEGVVPYGTRSRPTTREVVSPGCGPPSIANTSDPSETTPRPWRAVARSARRLQRPVVGSSRSTSPIIAAAFSPPTVTIFPQLP